MRLMASAKKNSETKKRSCYERLISHWSTSHHKFDDRVFFVTYNIKKEGALEMQSLVWGPSALARNYIYKICIKNEEERTVITQLMLLEM